MTSRNIGSIIVLVIVVINFLARAASKANKENTSNKQNNKAKPFTVYSGNKKSSPHHSKRAPSDIEKEYLSDHDFSGTFSQNRESNIPSPEIEDPKDSKKFYVIVLGILVFALAVFLAYYYYWY